MIYMPVIEVVVMMAPIMVAPVINVVVVVMSSISANPCLAHMNPYGNGAWGHWNMGRPR